uniref:Tumor necrosis factor receptor superfamily n=1 Tax=Echinococcus granulosus TaxID=6210 RepID=A0A068WHM0_ECHGR|nr:tumor necrosis factor receptor superfamily [Echinococcus granulosus]
MLIPLLIWTLLSSFRCSAMPHALQQSLNSTQLDPIQRETCPSANEELVSTLNGPLRCCNKCPSGEGMLQLCTNQTQTVCRPCQEGSEFSLEASATAKCMQCRQCQELHPFAKFRKHCTPTSDAVCECVSGYFFIEAHSTCQSCTKCPPGQGAEKPCEWNENSVCKPCAEGTWSSTDSATDTCQTCRRCKPGQIEMRPCTATQNTLCCPLHNPNCQDTFAEEEFDGMLELIACLNIYLSCIISFP